MIDIGKFIAKPTCNDPDDDWNTCNQLAYYQDEDLYIKKKFLFPFLLINGLDIRFADGFDD